MRKLVSSLLLSAVLAAPALAQSIKIGAPQPLTGPDAPFGDKFKKAYGMAIEEINAASSRSSSRTTRRRTPSPRPSPRSSSPRRRCW